MNGSELAGQFLLPTFLAFILMLVIIGSIAIDVYIEEFDFFNIKSVVLFIFTFIYGLSAFDRIFFRQNITTVVANEGAHLTTILIYAICGVTIFELAYRFTGFFEFGKIRNSWRDKQTSIQQIDMPRINAGIIGTYIAAILGVLILEAAGRGIVYRFLNPLDLTDSAELDWWFYFVQWLIFSVHVGCWLLFCRNISDPHRQDSNMFRSVILIILAIFISLCLNRTAIINLFLPLIIIYNYYVKTIKPIYIISTFALAIFYFISWDIYRNATVGNTFIEESGISAVYDGFMANLDYIDTFINVLDKMKNDEFQNGGTFLTVLFKPIPRSLWLDKPPGANTFVTSIVSPTALTTGYSRSSAILLEAYVNFGFFGILGVMSTLGVACRVLFKYLKANLDNPFSILYYSIAFLSIYTFTRVDAQISTTFAMYYLLPLSLIVKRKSKKVFSRYKLVVPPDPDTSAENSRDRKIVSSAKQHK
jgi:oligosaccharide repeat unit polymerase